MTFVPHEDFGVNLVRNTPDGSLHAERHMDLCRAIDMLGLGIVLEKMVKTGHVSQQQARVFHDTAQGLLNILLSENARSFAGSKEQSTSSAVRYFGVNARVIYPFNEEACPGHVASFDDPKVCKNCGTHVDSMRPDEIEKPIADQIALAAARHVVSNTIVPGGDGARTAEKPK